MSLTRGGRIRHGAGGVGGKKIGTLRYSNIGGKLLAEKNEGIFSKMQVKLMDCESCLYSSTK